MLSYSKTLTKCICNNMTIFVKLLSFTLPGVALRLDARLKIDSRIVVGVVLMPLSYLWCLCLFLMTNSMTISVKSLPFMLLETNYLK